MEIRGAEVYHHHFTEFLEEVILDEWVEATVELFFYWESGGFRLDHFYHDKQGERKKFPGSLNKRGISQRGLLKATEALKKLTIQNDQEKWNVLAFQLGANRNERLKVHWDQNLENEYNPQVEPDRDSLIDARLSSPDYLESKVLRQDFDSKSSTRPYYFIQKPEVGIVEIVRSMIEEGSELQMVDFELIDFGKSKWGELEELVKSGKERDSEFKMMLDGDWDSVNRRYMNAKFTYMLEGQEYNFEILL